MTRELDGNGMDKWPKENRMASDASHSGLVSFEAKGRLIMQPQNRIGLTNFKILAVEKALVTQLMLQRRSNWTELSQSIYSYTQILCRFQKSRQKVPQPLPPTPLIFHYSSYILGRPENFAKSSPNF